MNKMYLVLGDWSNDGHGKTKKILYEVNHTVEKVQQAYKNSCKLTGISFNHDEDYTGLKRGWKETKKYQICVEYENTQLPKEVIGILEAFNCPLVNDLKIANGYIEDMFNDLWWWFISLSLDNLHYTLVEDTIPVINGYWNKNLNVQFGYGLFY